MLEHWKAFRLSHEGTDATVHRAAWLMQMQKAVEKDGRERTRRIITEALKGERPLMIVHTIFAAAYFPDIPGLDVHLRRGFDSPVVERAIASIFSSSFFFDIRDDLLFTLSERVLEGPGDGPDFGLERRRKASAAGEVLELWSDIRCGGSCRRCGKKAG